MISRILLDNVRPASFTPSEGGEVWGWSVCFEKEKSYLLNAASGRGKTSLLNFIYGSRKDYTGDVYLILSGNGDEYVFGYPLSDTEITNVRFAGISFLFQDLKLFPKLTAMENVELKNRLTHFRSQSSICSLFEMLQIADKMNVRTENLSMGQQQKVAFIRALCQPMSFLMLDEPVSHLDKASAGLMAQALSQEQKKLKFGIIVTSVGYNLPLDYTEVLNL